MKTVYYKSLATVIALILVASYFALTLWTRHSQVLTDELSSSNQVEMQMAAECARIPPVNTQERADCNAKYQLLLQQTFPLSPTDSRSVAALLER